MQISFQVQMYMYVYVFTYVRTSKNLSRFNANLFKSQGAVRELFVIFSDD